MSLPAEKEDEPTVGVETTELASPKVDEDGKAMRRHTLKRGEKLKILEERDRRVELGLSARLADLQTWAQSEFSLENPPSRSAMSRILCTTDKTALVEMPAARRKRGGRLPELEVTLANWVRAQQAANIHVKGDLIKEKGKSLLEAFNATLPSGERLAMQFSAGWLCNFQRRWDLQLSTKDMKEDEIFPSGGGGGDENPLEQVIGTDSIAAAAADVGSLVGSTVPNGPAASAVAPLRSTPEQSHVHYVSPISNAQLIAKRKRIPFWFIGLDKLSSDQFATRFVNYICQQVPVSNKGTLREMACAAAKANGIDGFTVAFGTNSNDQITDVLLDDLSVPTAEKQAIISAGKLYFYDLDEILGSMGAGPSIKKEKANES